MSELMVGTIEQKDKIEQLKVEYLKHLDEKKFNEDLLKVMNWEWAPFFIDSPSSLKVSSVIG